ncbi:thioredoxin family protein [bacterium]|nr:MAG: thioredoxin family protein [bacterium]
MKKLLILGTGCAKCEKLMERTRAAVDALQLEYDIAKVSEVNDILKYGVMSTPALVVDGDVKCVGRVPDVDEIKALIGPEAPA